MPHGRRRSRFVKGMATSPVEMVPSGCLGRIIVFIMLLNTTDENPVV